MDQTCRTASSLIITKDTIPAPRTVHIESNCACPADGFSLAGEQLSVATNHPYVLPPLHLAPLAEGFHLAFNPLGNAGVCVLDDAALRVLQSFQQPRTLTSAGASPAGVETARRLIDLRLLHPVGGTHALRRAPPQTLTAWLHVTNACNLRCSYCYVNKTPDAMELERGRQAVDAVFRSALAHGFRHVTLKFAGGEATLNFPTLLLLHDHAQQLAAAHGLKLESVVLSNGVALTNRMIAALQARRIRLTISLDGVGAQHDVQRPFVNGRGSFQQVARALDRLAAHSFTPAISITISRRNLTGLPAVVAYVLERDLPFKLNFYRENDCSASMTDLAYVEEQVIAAMRRAFAVIEADLPAYSLLEALVDLARLDTPHEYTCGVGQSYMVIDQRGQIAKCHMELDRPIGDIGMADPLELLRVDPRGVQNLPVDEKEGCRDCNWRYWCAGGCPVLTYRVTGRFDVKSPNCRIYTTLFPEVLRLEGLRLLRYSGVLTA